MTMRCQRGVALVETALMMSFISLLLYGLVQMGLASYYQVSADGASFVGSHTAIQNDPNSTGSGAAIAAQSAENVFAGLGAATVHLFHPTSTTTETDVSFASLNDGPPGTQVDPKTYSRTVDSSAAGSSTQQFPPNNSVLCLDNAINATTGAVTTASINSYSPGTLTTVASSSANALAGSLSITPQTIAATFGTTQPQATGVDGALNDIASAQAAVSADLTTINQGVALLTQTPLLNATTVATMISGSVGGANVSSGGTTTAPAPNSFAGLVSGQSGAVASSTQGTLSSAQVTAIQNLLNYGTQTGVGIVPTLNTLLKTLPVGSNATAKIQALVTSLTNFTPHLMALNAAQTELTTIDAKAAKPACKAAASTPPTAPSAPALPALP